MPTYLVTVTLEVGADSRDDAAMRAADILRDGGVAMVLDVTEAPGYHSSDTVVVGPKIRPAVVEVTP